MNIKKLKELKKRIENNDYYTNWYLISQALWIGSFVAQLAIIFFGFFYAKVVITRANPDLDPLVIGIVSAVLLSIVELLKRSITDKWSLDVIKKGFNLRPDFILMTIVSLGLYALSFFFSLNGAEEFSDRSSEVETNTTQNIEQITDSLRLDYNSQIDELEEDVIQRTDQFNQNPTVVGYLDALEKLNERGWKIDQESRDRLQPQYDRLFEQYEEDRARLLNQVSKLETERDSVITQKREDILSSSTEEQAGVQDAIGKFKYFTIGFELLIMIGVFFKRFFNHRSVKDFERRLENDPKLNRWWKWDQLMDIMYQSKFNTLQQGTRLPKPADLAHMTRLEGINVPENEVKEFYKLLTQLQIVDSRGAYRYINQPYEGAKKTLAKQFDIDFEGIF